MKAIAAASGEPTLEEDDRGLSLRQLMESLAPGELPSDPNATLYFPIDEREARRMDAAPAQEEELPHDSGLGLARLRGQGFFARARSSVARLPRTRKLTLIVLFALVGLALVRGRGQSKAQSTEQDTNPGMATAPRTEAERHAPPPSSAPPLAPESAPRFANPPFELEPGASLEHAAVERIANGDFGAALPLYRRLAAAHAERPVFAEAARLLERRTPHPSAQE